MKTLLALPYIACLYFSACATTDPDNGLIIYENAGVTIKLVDVQDSRCPKDVQCIWEGDAVVTLRINSADTTQNFVLHTNPKQEEGKLAETEIFMHHIQLLDVSPYPLSTANDLELIDYEIDLQVTKL